MNETRTTEQILRDAKIRRNLDPQAARLAARERAERAFAAREQEILDQRETQSDRDGWFSQDN